MLTQWVVKINDIVSNGLAKIDAKTRNVTQRFEKLQSSINGVQKAGNSLSPILRNVAIGVAAAFTASTIVDFGADIMRLTATHQKYNAVLTNTFQSSEAAAASMQMIKDIAQATPFGVDELTASYIKLVNQGFVPTAAEMTKMGDLASSTGKSFDQLAEAILDANTLQFERLKEFGIKAEQSADKITFTFKGQATQIDKSAASIQNYLVGLGDLTGVSGSMAAIMKTPEGVFSNLQDKMDGFKLKLGTQLMPVAIKFMEALSNALDWLQRNWSLIGDIFAGVWNGIKIMLYPLAALTVLVAALTAEVWLQNLAWMMNPLFWIPAAIIAVATAFTLLWRRCEKFRGFLIGLWEAVKTIFSNIWNAGKRYLGGLGELLIGIFTLDTDKIKSGLKNAFGGVADFWTGAGKGVGEAYGKGFDKGVAAVRANKSEGGTTNSMFPVAPTAGGGNTQTNKALDKASRGSLEGSSQRKYITVNINKLVETFRVETTNLSGMSMKQVEDKITEVIVRAVGGAELNLGN